MDNLGFRILYLLAFSKCFVIKLYHFDSQKTYLRKRWGHLKKKREKMPA